MYEYKCSNENCSEIWTIQEGNIGTLYLTCPYCKKGKGVYLRQIKQKPEFEKFMRKKPENVENIEENVANIQKNTQDDSKNEITSKSVENIKENTTKVKQEDKQVASKHSKNENDQINKVNKVNKEHKSIEQQNNDKPEKVMKNQIGMEQLQGDGDSQENIFDRIKRKRQLEKEFLENEGEDVDILEVAGNSIEEIEKRIKEFEEYYYIKVLDRKISKQGDRYNCIIKYQRR